MAKINLGRVVGEGLEFRWEGTRLGIKKESDGRYQYVDLQGPKGQPGDSSDMTKDEIINLLGYTPEDKENAKKEIARLENIIGSLSDLTTEDKTSIVSAINELFDTKVTQEDIDRTINDYNLAIGQVISEVQNKVLAMDVDKAEKSDLKKLDKELNDKIGNLSDLTTEEKENIVKAINELMKNKATHQDILDEIDEYNIAVGIVTGDLTNKVLELNSKKADKDDVVTSVNGQKGDVVIESGGGDSIRTATFVIANYDSHENSKKGADLVLGEDDDVFDEIGKIMEDMVDTGGVIQLMEGHYKTYAENGPFEGKDGIIIRGLGDTTVIENVGNGLAGRTTSKISIESMKITTSASSPLGWKFKDPSWDDITFVAEGSGIITFGGTANITNSRFEKNVIIRNFGVEGLFACNIAEYKGINIDIGDMATFFNIINGEPKVEGI